MITPYLSNSLDAAFCVSALERALRIARPEIFNTDQGCQLEVFTCGVAIRQRATSTVDTGVGTGSPFTNL